jgi:hypothetical protein
MSVALVILTVILLEFIYWFGKGYIHARMQRWREDREADHEYVAKLRTKHALEASEKITFAAEQRRQYEKRRIAAQRREEYRREEAERHRKFAEARRTDVALKAIEKSLRLAPPGTAREALALQRLFKWGRKRLLRKELAALPSPPLAEVSEKRLGLLAELALLNAINPRYKRAAVWRVGAIYRECLRRNRADIWFDTKACLADVFPTLPEWIAEREDALEGEKIERLWSRMPDV